jgi:hypothetical protein
MPVQPLEVLRAARESGDVVRIRRKLKRAERLEGFVVGIGKQWVLLHLVDDVVLDGYAAVRLKDVDKVRVYVTAESFTQRALAFNGHRAQPLANVDLSAATASSLVCSNTFRWSASTPIARMPATSAASRR